MSGKFKPLRVHPFAPEALYSGLIPAATAAVDAAFRAAQVELGKAGFTIRCDDVAEYAVEALAWYLVQSNTGRNAKPVLTGQGDSGPDLVSP